ncbi:hypothetical protein [Yoonia sp. 2307UL14-13]|uniref:hypothetical protein n=1 Tax=Yoonia sp. 2307UL14-13 TaxID=3126506 RepID=UPI0030AC374B
MKIRHLRSRLRLLLEEIEHADPEAQISVDALSELASVAAAIRTETEVELQNTSDLKIEDEWILDLAYKIGHTPHFIETFSRFSKVASEDFAKLYQYSCLFFYRRESKTDGYLMWVERYKTIMREAIDEEKLHRLLERLKKNRVLSEG